MRSETTDKIGIRKGDRITIKKEWRDPGDENLNWIARNDEEKGRVDISAIELSKLPVWPIQTVKISMIEKIS